MDISEISDEAKKPWIGHKNAQKWSHMLIHKAVTNLYGFKNFIFSIWNHICNPLLFQQKLLVSSTAIQKINKERNKETNKLKYNTVKLPLDKIYASALLPHFSSKSFWDILLNDMILPLQNLNGIFDHLYPFYHFFKLYSNFEYADTCNSSCPKYII